MTVGMAEGETLCRLLNPERFEIRVVIRNYVSAWI